MKFLLKFSIKLCYTLLPSSGNRCNYLFKKGIRFLKVSFCFVFLFFFLKISIEGGGGGGGGGGWLLGFHGIYTRPYPQQRSDSTN